MEEKQCFIRGSEVSLIDLVVGLFMLPLVLIKGTVMQII